MQITEAVFGHLPIFSYFQTSNYVIFHATKSLHFDIQLDASFHIEDDCVHQITIIRAGRTRSNTRHMGVKIHGKMGNINANARCPEIVGIQRTDGEYFTRQRFAASEGSKLSNNVDANGVNPDATNHQALGLQAIRYMQITRLRSLVSPNLILLPAHRWRHDRPAYWGHRVHALDNTHTTKATESYWACESRHTCYTTHEHRRQGHHRHPPRHESISSRPGLHGVCVCV